MRKHTFRMDSKSGLTSLELSMNPSILLLDEPAAGLPTAEALEMMEGPRIRKPHIGWSSNEHNVELAPALATGLSY